MTQQYYHKDSMVARAVELFRPHADLTEDQAMRLLISMCETKRQAQHLRTRMQDQGLLKLRCTLNLTESAREAKERE